MPGTGVRTASNIPLGIGGDIANFTSAAHLAAYAGIAPATGQSGTSIKGERPSRRGNKRLRTRCGSPCSSRPPNTRRPSPTTSANANRASTTTPLSSASRADAAT